RPPLAPAANAARGLALARVARPATRGRPAGCKFQSWGAEASGQAQSRFFVQNHFQYLFRMAGANRDYYFWMSTLESLEHIGQEVNRDGERRCDLQRAATGRFEFVHGLACLRGSL